jgi:hypothetical protein
MCQEYSFGYMIFHINKNCNFLPRKCTVKVGKKLKDSYISLWVEIRSVERWERLK